MNLWTLPTQHGRVLVRVKAESPGDLQPALTPLRARPNRDERDPRPRTHPHISGLCGFEGLSAVWTIRGPVLPPERR
jgi:hypothetical protein